MASVQIPPMTPSPAFVTETRKVREDDRAIATEPTVDVSPDARKLQHSLPSANENVSPKPPQNAPIETALSDVRPVIERLDGEKDIAQTLDREVPDTDDRALQAKEAYTALRESDTETVPVGTA